MVLIAKKLCQLLWWAPHRTHTPSLHSEHTIHLNEERTQLTNMDTSCVSSVVHPNDRPGEGGAHEQRTLSIIHQFLPQSIILHVLYITWLVTCEHEELLSPAGGFIWGFSVIQTTWPLDVLEDFHMEVLAVMRASQQMDTHEHTLAQTQCLAAAAVRTQAKMKTNVIIVNLQRLFCFQPPFSKFHMQTTIFEKRCQAPETPERL